MKTDANILNNDEIPTSTDIEGLREKLKEVYATAPDGLKHEAWEVFNKSDAYFRDILNRKKAPKLSTIIGVVNALKLALPIYLEKHNLVVDNFENSIVGLKLQFEFAEKETQLQFSE